ncbi:hypothetical protein NDU88_009860 [Pleurodeles waltl]|uniref:Uncharacterized protein n=1 Tax=Pleurodeles waltl TaxID=8319 RepID=A0AAV7S1L9_PLEWA|nr:hypothetical protein NDU88_009860 [Pleurodeles waltl]
MSVEFILCYRHQPSISVAQRILSVSLHYRICLNDSPNYEQKFKHEMPLPEREYASGSWLSFPPSAASPQLENKRRAGRSSCSIKYCATAEGIYHKNKERTTLMAAIVGVKIMRCHQGETP